MTRYQRDQKLRRALQAQHHGDRAVCVVSIIMLVGIAVLAVFGVW